MSGREYIIEFYAVGNSVKVSAIDPKSFREVCVIVPKNIPENEMKNVAIQKLEYVLKKEKL